MTQDLPLAAKVLIGFIVLSAAVGGLLRLTKRAPDRIADRPAAVQPVEVEEPLDLVAPPSIGGAPRFTKIVAKQSEHILYEMAGGSKAGDIEIAYYGHAHPEYAFLGGANIADKVSYAKLADGARKAGDHLGPPRSFPGGYQCATLGPDVLCLWSGTVSAGMVMAFDSRDVAAVAAATAKARTALETRH